MEAQFRTLSDTHDRERREDLETIAKLREQLEKARRLRASDLEGIENRLAEAAAARLELSSRLDRSQKMALSLGALALILALAAIILLNT